MRKLSSEVIHFEHIDLGKIVSSLESIAECINNIINKIVSSLESIAECISNIINTSLGEGSSYYPESEIIVDISHMSIIDYIEYLIELSKNYIPNLSNFRAEHLEFINEEKCDAAVKKINEIENYARYLIDTIKGIKDIFNQQYRDAVIDKLIV